jgi:hypothetical protein
MPKSYFIMMLLSVLAAAALTVWLLTFGGTHMMVAALPVFLIAALALKVLRR